MLPGWQAVAWPANGEDLSLGVNSNGDLAFYRSSAAVDEAADRDMPRLLFAHGAVVPACCRCQATAREIHVAVNSTRLMMPFMVKKLMSMRDRSRGLTMRCW